MDVKKMNNRACWAEAKKHLVGGVNSPVRSFRSVGGEPLFMKTGRGAYLFDVNGKRYVDFCMSWGALLFGHADKLTVQAIQNQAKKGTSFGTVTDYETKLAVEIKKAFPSIQKIRFVSSGTEAVMSAIRLARGVTQKRRIVKFEGCYHGHSDNLLVKAGSGLATFGAPDSQGVPSEIAKLTSVLPYNDARAVINFFKTQKDIACVIVEPVAGNMGVIPAKKDFLEALKYVNSKNDTLLIFDEVISGFRVAYGGAQSLYKIKPDITILGKIIGGGLPVGAFGGSDGIMSRLSPMGKVYQAGTLSGNPLSMAAGSSVLSKLSKQFYDDLEITAKTFTQNVEEVLKQKGLKVTLQRAGSMFTAFFSKKPVLNFADALACDHKAFNKVFHRLLSMGVYLPPSSYESLFLSAAHTQKSLDFTIRALKKL